jgi:hypothetical protein
MWNAAPQVLRLRDMEKGLGTFLVRNIRAATKQEGKTAEQA